MLYIFCLNTACFFLFRLDYTKPISKYNIFCFRWTAPSKSNQRTVKTAEVRYASFCLLFWKYMTVKTSKRTIMFCWRKKEKKNATTTPPRDCSRNKQIACAIIGLIRVSLFPVVHSPLCVINDIDFYLNSIWNLFV